MAPLRAPCAGPHGPEDDVCVLVVLFPPPGMSDVLCQYDAGFPVVGEHPTPARTSFEFDLHGPCRLRVLLELAKGSPYPFPSVTPRHGPDHGHGTVVRLPDAGGGSGKERE